jgi:predicted lipid-binding transport protein (Tim44 family)
LGRGYGQRSGFDFFEVNSAEVKIIPSGAKMKNLNRYWSFYAAGLLILGIAVGMMTVSHAGETAFGVASTLMVLGIGTIIGTIVKACIDDERGRRGRFN